MKPGGTGAGLALRPVEDSDSEFLYELYASTRAEELALTGWSELQKQEFLKQQFSAQSKFYAEQFETARFEVIELGDRPVGRLYVDERVDEIRIIDIALLPEFRRRGIGSHYLHDILARAVSRHCPVTIHVERNNPAMGLYERLGFERIEDKGVYWFMCWSAPPAQENTAS